MTEPYTPSLDEVRDDYVIENMRGYDEFQAGEPAAARRARYRLRFDRLIGQVRAETLRDAAQDFEDYVDSGAPVSPYLTTEKWLRTRADRIERGETA